MLRFTRALFVLLIVALSAACSTGDSAPESISSEPTTIEGGRDTSDYEATPIPRNTATLAPMMAALPTQTGVSLADVRVTATALSMEFAESTPIAGLSEDGVGGGSDIALAATRVPDTASVNVVQVSPLNAGEIDDNALWNDYLTYRTEFLSWGSDSVRDVDINQRETITVTDAEGLPVLGARVLIYSGQTFITESRTYATGRTLFFPSAWANAQNAQSFRVVVQQGNSAVQFTLDPQLGTDWHVTLDAAQTQTTAQLDVLFLLDATSSMSDEITQLQNNILSISTQVNQTLGNTDVRYGLVTYRDHGDDYVTRTYDFVSDVQSFQTELNRVRAQGGGDTPEALNEGLRAAVRDVSWRGDDTIKLIFLVADAVPHLDYANDVDYSHEMIAAAWQGIKIFPIASSGLTPDGEYVFRQMAQYTMGHFIFLTYESGTSGPTGETRTDLAAGDEIQQQQNYSVEQLDELVLQRISDEIAALSFPIDMQGVDAQLRTVSAVAENAAPTSFSLFQPPPLQQFVESAPREDVVVVPPRVIESAPVIVSRDTQFTMTFIQLVGAIFACSLILYSISLVYHSGQRKRKNDETFGAVKKETERIEQTRWH